MNAHFVKNPINGLENDALLIDELLFDVNDIWYACNYGLSADEFYNLFPADMAVIALELFDAEMIEAIA